MSESWNILIVEDSEEDILLLRSAFRDSKHECDFTIVNSGKAAIDLLFKQDNSDYDLIILDIQLPDTNGKKLLKLIKNDDRLRNIPTIMLSTSTGQNDILESLNDYADGYIIKPRTLNEYTKTILTIENILYNSMESSKETPDSSEDAIGFDMKDSALQISFRSGSIDKSNSESYRKTIILKMQNLSDIELNEIVIDLGTITSIDPEGFHLISSVFFIAKEREALFRIENINNLGLQEKMSVFDLLNATTSN